MTASVLLPPRSETNSLLSARVGSQEARLRSVPAYALTLGNEAADLAAAAGLILDPWQRDEVCDILAVDSYGTWCSFETCTVCQRQTGKGGIIETIELGGLFLFGERLILHSAHEYKTAQEAFLRIKALIDGCADLSRYVKAIRETNGEQQVILMDGARLRFVARSKGSGRGFSAPRNMIDEAFALTRTQYAALLPTTAAMPNPQVNLFSTVPDPATMPDPEEAVLLSVHDRALHAARSGEPGRLCYRDYSVRREELPAGDPVKDPAVARVYIDLAYQCNPALGIRITEEYVEAELAALGAAKFGVERLGLWPLAAGSGWLEIPEDAWTDATDASSAVEGQVAFAVAVSADRNWASIAAAGRRADGLRHVEIIKHGEGTAWVVPWLTQPDPEAPHLDGLSRIKKHRPCAVVVAPTGHAGSLIADLIEANVGKLLRTPTVQQWGQASAAFYDGVAGTVGPDEEPRVVRDVRHRGQKALTDAVRLATKRKLGESWAWERPLDSDGSPLEAGTLALWGFVMYGRKGVIDGDLMGGDS